MPRKIDLITELHRQTVAGLTSDREHWCSFLQTAAYQYKYPFADQVLIYAQKPGATACAKLEVWNRYFNRRVKRGAHGIALMREKNGHLFLDHVFDVSDTYSRAGENLKLWSVREEYANELMTMLGNRYGDVNKRSFIDAVVSAAYIAAEDNLPDYKEELFRSAEGSFLDVYDDDSLRFRLQEVLQASVAYTVLTRLGYRADHYVDTDAFDHVHEFSTPATVSVLGAANGDISEIILRDIERTAKACEKNLQEQNRTFDGISEIGYNESEERNTKENGGFHYDNQLHDEGRGTVPESDLAGTGRQTAGQVRNVTPDLSERTPQGDIFPDVGERDSDRTLIRNRADSTSTDFGEYIPDGTEPWGNRADESRESDEMGGTDEPYQGDSRRTGAGRSDLSLDQSVDQSNAAIRDSKLPNVTDMQTLIQILRHGDYLRKSKEDIVSFLSSDASEAEKVTYVKEAYPPLQFSEFFKSGTQDHLGYRADDKGLLIYEGHFLSRTAESVMTWSLVTDLIDALIKDKNYLDEPKADKQPLFHDVPEVQDETLHPTEPVKEPAPSKSQQNFAVPQEVIDEFLRLGGCVRNSTQRIYGFYRRANNQAENVAFLKREYETDSVGIIINDRKYAVKWDSDGVLISTGERVSDVSSAMLSWEQIDKRIRELLEAGQYLPQSEAEKATDVWDSFVAGRISLMYRDVFNHIPEEYKTTSKFIWPEVDEFYKDIIRTPEKLEAFIKEVDSNIKRLDAYPPGMRLYLKPQEILGYLKSYRRDPVEFPKADPNILPPKQFVTQDKIDSFLIKQGSSVSGSKLRTYSFFLRNKDNAERAKFLSGDYGQGGTAGLRTDNSHDGKGLFLCGGLQDNTTGVLLKWPQVAKRIDELIRQDKYLTDQEIAGLDLYEKKQIAGSIQGFYQNKNGAVKPYSSEYEIFDVDKIEADLLPQLEHPERVKEILAEMQTAFDSVMPGSYHYDYDMQAIADVKAYVEGRYNLFPGSRYRKKEPVREEVKIIRPAEEAKTADVDLSQYGLHIPLGTWLFIGTEELQLSSATEDGVELYNGTLFPVEMPLDVFVRRVKDNPLNDHLKIEDGQLQINGTQDEKTAESHSKVADLSAEDLLADSEYRLRVGTEVYLLQGKYTVQSIHGSTVELQNGLMIPTHMELEYFMSKLRGNPLNDHLRKDHAGQTAEMTVPPESHQIKSDINAHEAEIGADRYRAFPGNRPEQENSEPLSIWQRYEQVKQLYPEAVAAIRVGDFYEFFAEDAERVSELLDLTLTTRQTDGAERVPMCGIPFHATEKYFSKLLDAGIRVAVDDNDLTPKLILPNTAKQENELERAKTYIREYLIREFDEKEDHFENLNKITLAYTTTEDENIPIQVEVDLKGYAFRKYLGDILVETKSFDSLKEMNDNLLCGLDFGKLTEVTDDQIALYHRETDIPQFTEKAKQRKTLPVYNAHPEIPDSEKHNYRITDNEIGMGGAKEKFRKNIAAINLLHELELDDRLATPEEQEILAQYSGWGGLADAFDESKDNWSSEFTELYTTLSPEEYRAAEESTLTAFYTPPVVIKAMYQALENMGFKRGNILEPSCGVGNFMGLVPESMDARMYGVELDSLSGRIAQQLYQKNGITVSGYEKTDFPDSFFDVAIGNVPFNDFKLLDKRYDKYNFLIHDYFFAKTLDKVRPGGVIAFITSNGTLDKQNPSVRKYISQRADFLGAIRLPNNTFNGAGAQKVVSDIIFLQKRDRIIDRDEDWIHLGKDENGIPMNQYFVDHPDMVLGEMMMRSGPYGPEPTCRAYENQDLEELLSEAITNIHAEIAESEIEELTGEETAKAIPADPTVKNFSFTLVDGKVYYRQNSMMNPVETSVTGENRIKGMIAIRNAVRELIDAQLENAADDEIRNLQAKLNLLYDNFTYKYGLINSRANSSAFSDDNSYFLLCSLEILDDNKQLKAKADMFYKRTIKPQTAIDRVDTASEALAVSIGERAGVDMEYMSELTGKSEEELFADLGSVVFLNPRYDGEKGSEAKYLTADEYLSGNVREKFREAKAKAEEDGRFTANAEALEQVQPADLTAAEIGVKLGSTWIPEEDVKAFIMELLTPSYYVRRGMEVKYIGMTGQWVITGKNYDGGNVKANSTYGTKRINAYHIIEETLNLKDVRVMDYVEDGNGNRKAVLNKKETMIAQGKQEQIRRAFDEWIWKDPERRERLCRLYNEKFNSIRPREYDGSHIRFVGMNPEITLRQHQKNAVARSLYGGNALYAHVVGAGKTFTMVAAAQEGKRLGLCSKSMFVVPNHLIEQWASEYLQLYPSANILVTTKKDFETKNRKKFCARIATGDYDAVIIGHSQFEKIPVSVVRQMQLLQDEIDTITEGIEKLKYERGERVTVKQFQKMKKQLQTKLEKLNDQSRKDDVVCFEELGVDRLFVDESHFYKNLFAFTKMRNVAGIAQSEAQKSSDLFMKCRYLDELTGGKGITFATGTPISNTMVELYTIQRYLQFDELNARGLSSFDAWASTFGETVTAIELAPDGTGYRTKTRFAKFFNIPELMAMFKQVADVQTADMLNLPVPEAHFHVVKTAPSEIQKSLVQSFSERAEKIHNKMVTAQEDNMLLVTNDGRKAALDQRLIDPMLSDFEGSKVNSCVQNIFEIWEKNTDKKSAQLVFCDLSTPKNDGSFNVYDDIKTKLIQRGIPPEEIAFIHSADTDVKKKELFAKVRAGQVRVLLGSTFKMGAGTNVQQRLIALHDLDVPWRPSDLEQRSGRIIRQGNSNPEVDIYRYVTEGTFDAYCYQLLESKQKFISQIMTSKSPVRVAEDVDETALSYAEIKALASGNPLIMEKMQLDNDVAKLKLQKAEHLNQRYALEDKILKQFPKDIAEIEERIAGYTADLQTVREHTLQGTEGEKVFSPMVIMGLTYTERADAGKAILEICKKITTPESRPLGEYRGLKAEIGFDTNGREFFIDFKGKMTYRVSLGQDAGGIITRLDHALNGMEKQIGNCKERLAELHKQVENAKAEIAKPFPDEAILEEKCKRLDELNSELNMDKKENEIAEDEVETGEAESPKGNNRYEPDER